MISAFLHCFFSLWILLRFLFSFSWRSLPQKPSTTKTGPDGDQLPQSASRELTSSIREDTGYELHSAQNSFPKAQCRNGTCDSESDSFVDGTITRDSTIANHDTVQRNGSSFAAGLALTGHLDMLDLLDDKDTSQDLYADISVQNNHTLTDDFSALGLPSSLLTDLTDSEGDNILDDSLMLDILSGLTSEADLSTSYDADTSDDFLECTSLDWADIDSITAPDSSWKHDVATAMHAFRSCKANDDDILALLPEGTQRLSLRTRRSTQGKQLQEIQEWRNDFGNECDDGPESDMQSDTDYTVITAFRFP